MVWFALHALHSEAEEEEEDEESDISYADDSSGDEVDSPMVTKAPATKAPAASRLGASARCVRCTTDVQTGGDKAVPKRKPAAKAAAASLDSPAVVPSGKVRRIRPSPFHKGSGVAGGSQTVDMSDEEVVEVVPAARGARRGAAKKPVYVEDESEESEESEEGSDFVPDD